MGGIEDDIEENLRYRNHHPEDDRACIREVTESLERLSVLSAESLGEKMFSVVNSYPGLSSPQDVRALVPANIAWTPCGYTYPFTALEVKPYALRGTYRTDPSVRELIFYGNIDVERDDIVVATGLFLASERSPLAGQKRFVTDLRVFCEDGFVKEVSMGNYVEFGRETLKKLRKDF